MAEPTDEKDDGLVWECGPHTNAWKGHDARCRRVRPEPPQDRYVVTGPGGFTEMFNAHQVDVLVRLGLIEHDYDSHVLQDGSGRGVGALYHFYKEADRG